MLAQKQQVWQDEVRDMQAAAIPERVGLPEQIEKPVVDVVFRRRCFRLVALIALAAILILGQRAMIVREGYALATLKSQAIKMEKQNEQLRAEIGQLKSPQRIQGFATTQLGMVAPQTILYADASKNKAKPQAPSITEKGTVVARLDNAKI